MLPYNNTRHRYPWICSLRSKGAQTEHYCTVTLLSRPPRPTVVVGSAHCTYLCKRDPDSPVPTCCCADGPENCADENSSCGDNPQVYEMTGADVEVRTQGVHSGWTRPPPYHIVKDFLKSFTAHWDDFFKQWHYNMELTECRDARNSDSPYPAGLVCAREFTEKACFITGDSGAPLMLKKRDSPRFYTEGVLSFVKGCTLQRYGYTADQLSGDGSPSFLIQMASVNPAAYTKLSCYLPWIAQQYDLDYTTTELDPKCTTLTGNINDVNGTDCFSRSNNDEGDEPLPCIFPFYWDGKKYDSCFFLNEEGFVFPVFLCPRRNMTTKINGTNSFSSRDFFSLLSAVGVPFCEDVSAQQPGDRLPPLNPDKTDCDLTVSRQALSQCENNCRGGK